jgi:DnaB-like helicase N terminal domain
MSIRKSSPPPPKDPNEGLPANEDAERFVLGSILLDAETHMPPARRELEPGDFILQKHRTIFRCMIELDDRGEKIDRLVVANELKRRRELSSCDGLSYLVSLDDGLPDAPNIDAYIRIVKDKAALRRVIFGADAIMKRGLLDTEEADIVIAAGAEFFAGLQRGRNHRQEPPPSVPQWPEPLHADAYHGLAGDLVRAIAPQSEADPVGLLLQVLVGFGNMAGRGPYIAVEGDQHHTNEYAVLVGISSIARKGTSWGRVRGVLETTDEFWVGDCILSGLEAAKP